MSGTLDRSVKRLVIAALRLCFPGNPPSPPGSPRSILVIRQHNQLGDMLCVVPLLRALRSTYREARIVLMTSLVNHEVMEGNRFLDGTILYDKRDFLGKWSLRVGALLSFIQKLRAHAFDTVIVPSTVSMSFTSDLFAFLSGARRRIGPSSLDGIPNPSAFVYTEKAELDWRRDPHRHQTRRNLDVVAGKGIETDDLSSEITLTPGERERGKNRFLDLRGKGLMLVVYHPGAGKAANRWPAGRFARVANTLSRRWNARTIITCGPMDQEPVQEMVSALKDEYQLIQNEAIRVVASCLAEADLVITNDTGIMHVAGAVGAPVLSLFGPTDFRQWAPIGEQNRCLAAPNGRIEAITEENVIQTADEILRRRSVQK